MGTAGREPLGQRLLGKLADPLVYIAVVVTLTLLVQLALLITEGR